MQVQPIVDSRVEEFSYVNLNSNSSCRARVEGLWIQVLNCSCSKIVLGGILYRCFHTKIDLFGILCIADLYHLCDHGRV